MIPTPIDCAATVAPAKLTAFQVSFDTAVSIQKRAYHEQCILFQRKNQIRMIR